MKFTSSALAVVGLAATVQAHGFITSPKARMPGDAMMSSCGEQLYYQQLSDNYGNIQGELQTARQQSDYKPSECNVWLCKGFKFEDNKANVQSYTPGQKVDFKFDVRAPHTGVANVSIVNTKTNKVIGTPLLSYKEFAANSGSIPANQKAFSVTIPKNLNGQCAKAGDCVIQHFWDARSVDQTYQSCVDFTVGAARTRA